MDDCQNPSEPTIQQLFDLTGRVAVVTGGCGHLGSAMCRALAEAGASVVVTSRNSARACELARTLPCNSAARHFGIALDHMQTDSLTTSFEAALSLTSKLDILVNNGNEAVGADWTTVTPEEFSRRLSSGEHLFKFDYNF